MSLAATAKWSSLSWGRIRIAELQLGEAFFSYNNQPRFIKLRKPGIAAPRIKRVTLLDRDVEARLREALARRLGDDAAGHVEGFRPCARCGGARDGSTCLIEHPPQLRRDRGVCLGAAMPSSRRAPLDARRGTAAQAPTAPWESLATTT